MKRSLVAAAILAALAGTAEARSPVRPFETDADPAPQNRIDELVFARLKQLQPALVGSLRFHFGIGGSLKKTAQKRV